MSARVGFAEAAQRPGLVSVSTSPQDIPVAIQWAENVIEIDHAAQRCVRLRKSLGVAAKLLHNAGGAKQTKWLVTLTYAGGNERWAPWQITRFIEAVQAWYRRRTGSRKVRYAWVAELQQRGVIHYHVVLWLDQGLTLPKPDKQGWWPHGMSNRKRAIAPIAYLMKYVSKIETKNVGGFPHGARIHGHGGLDKGARDIRRWVLWPAYLQCNSAVGERWRPAKGGGYVNHEDGRFLRSEFAPTGGGFRHFIRVYTHPREVDASGPFSWNPHTQIPTDVGPVGYLH